LSGNFSFEFPPTFDYTSMARVSLLIGRLQFLLRD
jgi:hypothetical protein